MSDRIIRGCVCVCLVAADQEPRLEVRHPLAAATRPFFFPIGLASVTGAAGRDAIATTAIKHERLKSPKPLIRTSSHISNPSFVGSYRASFRDPGVSSDRREFEVPTKSDRYLDPPLLHDRPSQLILGSKGRASY